MCTLYYTVLCVIYATQDRDAGVISSPIFLLLMRRGDLGREVGGGGDIGDMSQYYMKNATFIVTF